MKLPYQIDKQALAKKLEEKKANPSCLSCGINDWAILGSAGLTPEWNNRLPAPGIPSAVMICNNCGFIRTHALGALDMLPNENGGENG